MKQAKGTDSSKNDNRDLADHLIRIEFEYHKFKDKENQGMKKFSNERKQKNRAK